MTPSLIQQPSLRLLVAKSKQFPEGNREAFGAMIEQHGIDPTRPQMEYYRSLTELHLLLPVLEARGA